MARQVIEITKMRDESLITASRCTTISFPARALPIDLTSSSRPAVSPTIVQLSRVTFVSMVARLNREKGQQAHLIEEIPTFLAKIIARTLLPLRDSVRSTHEVVLSIVETIEARVTQLERAPCRPGENQSCCARVATLRLQIRLYAYPITQFITRNRYYPFVSYREDAITGEEDDFNGETLQEEDDPDIDPTEVVELWAIRLESLAYARIKPHIDDDANT
ncbi:hypothetical protein HAX54_029282 [Datura stramonium]|uniref:Uncharacterized protein n=1 Tax=Datura stramonium TaxID=4076 RepID=A0ABS8V5W3_DATST|nr:hypothetical protein [Datura stramonium]